MSIIRNVVQNALRRKNLLVIADKVVSRAKSAQRGDEESLAMAWCEQHQTPIDEFAQTLDADLWQESVKFADDHAARCQQILENSAVKFGGAGAYHLLYFLTRLRRPRVVLETGVAAGWSSSAFLQALKKNGDKGKLYSSDFPYFRQQEPDKDIGLLVDESLKGDWQLHIDGDKWNLPKILKQIEHVDLFHYDSDKSYTGRNFAFDIVSPKLSDDAVIIFDDIHQNMHFRDLTLKLKRPFHVFQFGDKHLGLFYKQ